jgi:DNA-binding MarR family transcriptional regulator
MDNTYPPRSFYLSLIKFLLHSKQEILSSSTELGLSSMQAFTLLLANEGQPRSMNYFRKMYDCDASNVTGIIDGLEQKGLVSRQEHPHDRRIKDIVLEPAGQAVKTQVMHNLAAAYDDLLMILDAQELEQFIAIIDKLGAHDFEKTVHRTAVSA